MIAIATTMVAMALMAKHRRGEISIGFGAPLLVDLLAWYVIGAYLGVLPTL